MIGETFGNFRVTAKLGAGGMGAVYLAEQKNLGTKVAIKVLHQEISLDRAHVDRFFNEAIAVDKIKHTGTVKIYDADFHPTGHAYLVMEFLEGESLASRIKRIGGLSLRQISDLGKQACGVLEATHAAGITHRDLKPDNIFIVPDPELGERVKILDFGIAKLSGATAAGKPQTVGTMGTPAYMAPEQWGDSGKVDARADVYSMGCVLFEMATGRPPFIAATFAEACGAHLSQPPPKLRTIVPGFPPQLEALIDRMLAKQPEARPAIREVGEQLAALAMLPDASSGLAAASQVAPTVAPNAPTYGVAVHQPTPLDRQTRPNLVPGSDGERVPNTTLSASAGSAQAAPNKSKAPFVIGGIVVVGGIIAFAATRDGGKPAAVIKDAAVTVIEDAAQPDAKVIVVAPPDAAPTWTKPAFVDMAGAQVMPTQATRAQYKAYLGVALGNATPLNDWSDARPDDPVGWVTFEQATAFCTAANARLLSRAEWMAVARGSWRIGTGEPVFRDWTSTVTDGLAIVLGGTTTMPTDAARMSAVKNPLSKPTEASAGPNPPAGTIAAATIGIRCIRGTVTMPSTGAADASCDEVFCVANGKTDGCCAKFKKAPQPPTPTTGPLTPPTASCDKANVTAIEREADQLRSSGDYRSALIRYEKIASCNPALAQRAYTMACKAHEFDKAKRYFARLSNKDALAQICINEGNDPRN